MEIPDYPLDLAILASYFALIGLLAWRIYPQLAQALQQQPSDNQSSLARRLLFVGLASASFMATWTYMFSYFVYSYSSWKSYYGVDTPFSLNTMSHWLHGVTLFDDAWRTVCTGNWAWSWSIELCTFTVAVWTPIIAIEGSRRQIPHIWAYMVFGQVVAISTSSALFFTVALLHQTQNIPSTTNNVKTAPSWTLITLLYVVSVGGLVTVDRTPRLTASDQFLPNLLLMHGLLILPLLYLAIVNRATFTTIADDGKKLALQQHQRQQQQQQQKRQHQRHTKSYAIIMLYLLGAITNLYLISQQWRRTIDATTHPFVIVSNLINVFLQHPAQSSISSDVICVHVISVAWMLVNARTAFDAQIVTAPFWLVILSLVVCTPFLSPSVTLPLYFAMYEFFCHGDIIMTKNE